MFNVNVMWRWNLVLMSFFNLWIHLALYYSCLYLSNLPTAGMSTGQPNHVSVFSLQRNKVSVKLLKVSVYYSLYRKVLQLQPRQSACWSCQIRTSASPIIIIVFTCSLQTMAHLASWTGLCIPLCNFLFIFFPRSTTYTFAFFFTQVSFSFKE